MMGFDVIVCADRLKDLGKIDLSRSIFAGEIFRYMVGKVDVRCWWWSLLRLGVILWSIY